ncbi:RNA pyrophosphohydrolase [Roseospira marina]|uniref:RNA pyrophosphohydrolase n=1 Tax=Roseospira marina TaxID=140057 RepID=A0A5M6I9Q2_9PROT|nr:RNA pyrophosphohydrolase [Roseospira marina]KAA5604892.1 RNA pyrophosphohydrolase [Roseospira marina]MBB4315231.1 putative (di)nucleoside polyphosphate hydrolase [Roseospira marina]MBB5088231.1 putative (di)nucleoside polyphosphate hydrolase [Roseospira marina]
MGKQNGDGTAYRRGVGIMLANADGAVFVAQRIDFKSDAWQMPQGGIDPGEDPRDTADRELEEETGIPPRLTEVIAESPGWLRYDLPDDLRPRLWGGRYRGQEQKWYLMRFLGRDTDITLETEHPEFSAWRWAPPDQVVDLIVPFKRGLYTQVLDVFAPALADLRLHAGA